MAIRPHRKSMADGRERETKEEKSIWNLDLSKYWQFHYFTDNWFSPVVGVQNIAVLLPK